MSLLPKALEPYKEYIDRLIDLALHEDIRGGDITTLSTVNKDSKSTAKLLCKQEGVIAGVQLAEYLFDRVDPDLRINTFKSDGAVIKIGDVAFEVNGKTSSILTSERIVLNLLQHLSGVATTTKQVSSIISAYHTKLLDTRKTTPGLRYLEKWAVTIGGGYNHRLGLYDMVMIKDNHVDQCGSITKAVERCEAYLKEHHMDVKIEVETRNIKEVEEAMSLSSVDWIMLDNFNPSLIKEALKIINGAKITEASGGINTDNIEEYAKTGVDFISTSIITQKAKALDLSLKIIS